LKAKPAIKTVEKRIMGKKLDGLLTEADIETARKSV
jgi:hypothetical protein